MFVLYVRKTVLITAFQVHHLAWNAGMREGSGIRHNPTSTFLTHTYTNTTTCALVKVFPPNSQVIRAEKANKGGNFISLRG